MHEGPPSSLFLLSFCLLCSILPSWTAIYYASARIYAELVNYSKPSVQRLFRRRFGGYDPEGFRKALVKRTQAHNLAQRHTRTIFRSVNRGRAAIKMANAANIKYYTKGKRVDYHRDIYSQKTVQRTVPRFSQPKVVDTSSYRLADPRLGPYTYGPGTNPMKPNLPYKYQNKDWTIHTPWYEQWPSKAPFQPSAEREGLYKRSFEGFTQYYDTRTRRFETIPSWTLPLYSMFGVQHKKDLPFWTRPGLAAAEAAIKLILTSGLPKTDTTTKPPNSPSDSDRCSYILYKGRWVKRCREKVQKKIRKLKTQGHWNNKQPKGQTYRSYRAFTYRRSFNRHRHSWRISAYQRNRRP